MRRGRSSPAHHLPSLRDRRRVVPVWKAATVPGRSSTYAGRIRRALPASTSFVLALPRCGRCKLTPATASALTSTSPEPPGRAVPPAGAALLVAEMVTRLIGGHRQRGHRHILRREAGGAGFRSSQPSLGRLSRDRTSGSGQDPSPRPTVPGARAVRAGASKQQSQGAGLVRSRRLGTSGNLRNLRRSLFVPA